MIYTLLCPYIPFVPFGKLLQSHQDQRSQILSQAIQSQHYLKLSENIMLINLSCLRGFFSLVSLGRSESVPFPYVCITENNHFIELKLIWCAYMCNELQIYSSGLHILATSWIAKFFWDFRRCRNLFDKSKKKTFTQLGHLSSQVMLAPLAGHDLGLCF